jgi:hypothetical protein
MDTPVISLAPEQTAERPGQWYLSRVAVLALFLWHGWMTLTLFGPAHPWLRLLDSEPIVSGRHPLHLYHGYLGAESFRERGTFCCYDPSFQAGYPKTPVFDSGSRPAELFLTLAGGKYHPAVYKVGLALCCLAVPMFLLVAARGIGLAFWPSYIATLFGLLTFWSSACRQLLEAGDLDLLLGSLAAVAEVGLLIQFHRAPGLFTWLGLFATCCLGWFAQPLLFASLLPLFLLYYLSIGARHRPGWHAGLIGALLGGLAINSFWLADIFSYWWIRAPLALDGALLPHRTPRLIWAAPLWGDSLDRLLAAMLVGLGAIGVWVFNENCERATARLLGLGAAGFLILAVAGIAWEPLGRFGTVRLLVPALLFAALPAARAVAESSLLAARLCGGPTRGVALTGTLLGVIGLSVPGTFPIGLHRFAGSTPFAIGLNPEARTWVDMLRNETSADARILWEDPIEPEPGAHWSALLPLLTERAYLGGLDPDAAIEHAFAQLRGPNLAGRALAWWSDDELSDFCRRYDVGWIACRTPAVVARFRAWPDAKLVATIPGQEPGCLFRLGASSIALKGQAHLLHADPFQVALADLIPEDGKVVLSLHYQTGLRASPSRGVVIEKEPDARDPIPFIRLRVAGPISRLTLTWREE